MGKGRAARDHGLAPDAFVILHIVQVNTFEAFLFALIAALNKCCVTSSVDADSSILENRRQEGWAGMQPCSRIHGRLCCPLECSRTLPQAAVHVSSCTMCFYSAACRQRLCGGCACSSCRGAVCHSSFCQVADGDHRDRTKGYECAGAGHYLKLQSQTDHMLAVLALQN